MKKSVTPPSATGPGCFPLDADYLPHPAMTGMDEAGRGCLAGPVVAAAVTWRPDEARRFAWFAKLTDSKQLTAETRAWLLPRILAGARAVRTAVVGNIVIDNLNILRATMHAFELAAPGPDAEVPLVIDGNHAPHSLSWARTAVKGDSRLSAVAAAGVVAKVLRDAIMTAAATRYPAYGFERHKGYATRGHLTAIRANGPTPLHRRGFRGVTEALCPDEALSGSFLNRLASAAPRDMPGLWRFFQDHYHRLSAEAIHAAPGTFASMGWRLLPSPRDLPPAWRTTQAALAGTASEEVVFTLPPTMPK